jgi:hypothetical protein
MKAEAERRRKRWENGWERSGFIFSAVRRGIVVESKIKQRFQLRLAAMRQHRNMPPTLAAPKCDVGGTGPVMMPIGKTALLR